MIKTTSSPGFILLGMQGDFTFHVLDTLLNQLLKPEAVIIYGKQSSEYFSGLEIEVSQTDSVLIHRIKQSRIPFYFRTTNQLIATLEQHHAEILLTACWPKLIPDEVLHQMKSGAFNLHPSLLPDFAGASPIQDQLNSAHHNFGVTLHHMNAFYDSGDIVSQQAIGLAENPEFNQIEKACAIEGAKLFVKELKNLTHT